MFKGNKANDAASIGIEEVDDATIYNVRFEDNEAICFCDCDDPDCEEGGIGTGSAIYVYRMKNNLTVLNSTMTSNTGMVMRVMETEILTIENTIIFENYGEALSFTDGYVNNGENCLNLNNVKIKHNTSTSVGAGLSTNTVGYINIIDSEISYNEGVGEGGGLCLYNSGKIIDLTGTEISYNTVSNKPAERFYAEVRAIGGGIMIMNTFFGEYEVIGGTIKGNKVIGSEDMPGYGGGIFCNIWSPNNGYDNNSDIYRYGEIVLNGTIIEENEAINGEGGGIYADSFLMVPLVLGGNHIVLKEGTVIQGNKADGNGGGICFVMGEVREVAGRPPFDYTNMIRIEENVSIINNESFNGDGGGIYAPNYAAIYIEENVLFHGNKARFFSLDIAEGDLKILHENQVKTDQFSTDLQPFVYGYNNYDINYNAPICTVTLDLQNGEANIKTKARYGSLFERPTDPTKQGHEFAGWVVGAPNEAKWDFATTIKEDVLLFATWTKIETEAPTTKPSEGTGSGTNDEKDEDTTPTPSPTPSPSPTPTPFPTPIPSPSPSPSVGTDVENTEEKDSSELDNTDNSVNTDTTPDEEDTINTSHSSERPVIDEETLQQTDVPEVFVQLDEEGVPLGYYKRVLCEDGNVEWIEVEPDGTPLGIAFVKENPKTNNPNNLVQMINFLIVEILLLLLLCIQYKGRKVY